MNNNPPNPSVTEAMIEAGKQAHTSWQQSLDPRNGQTMFGAIYLAMRAADQPPPNTDLTEVERARKLAAEIMAAMRRARFPKEYPAEAHDEFEALTLVPMLEAALLVSNRSGVERLREALNAAKPLVSAHGDHFDGTDAMVRESNRVSNMIERALRGVDCLKHGVAFISPGLCPFCDEQARTALDTEKEK